MRAGASDACAPGADVGKLGVPARKKVAHLLRVGSQRGLRDAATRGDASSTEAVRTLVAERRCSDVRDGSLDATGR